MRTVRDASGAISFIRSKEDIEKERAANGIKSITLKYKKIEEKLDDCTQIISKISDLEIRMNDLEKLVLQLKTQLDGVENDR